MAEQQEVQVDAEGVDKKPNRLLMNPHGARIEELTLAGTKLLTTVVRGDRKKASTHPCSPIFGPETKTSFGLSQHGPMRNTLVDLKDTGSRILVKCAIKEGSYPEGLIVHQIAELKDKEFNLTTTHQNSGQAPLPVNFGEHLYWETPKGWEGLTINGKDVTGLVKKNGVIELLTSNEIVVPGLPKITLDQEGLNFAVLWTAQKPDGSFDSHYVCIEPVEGNPSQDFFGSPQSLIQPGSSRTTSLTIKI